MNVQHVTGISKAFEIGKDIWLLIIFNMGISLGWTEVIPINRSRRSTLLSNEKKWDDKII
jgi:hypothetical protein